MRAMPGAQAAAALAERLNVAGIANAIVSPLHGDDFNDDLRRGATSPRTMPLAEPASAAPSCPEHRAEFEAAGARR